MLLAIDRNRMDCVIESFSCLELPTLNRTKVERNPGPQYTRATGMTSSETRRSCALAVTRSVWILPVLAGALLQIDDAIRLIHDFRAE